MRWERVDKGIWKLFRKLVVGEEYLGKLVFVMSDENVVDAYFVRAIDHQRLALPLGDLLVLGAQHKVEQWFKRS